MADMILVLCILMSAYFIRGITGFGSGLISVPLLATSVAPKRGVEHPVAVAK